MTVKELRDELELMPDNKIVIITEPDGTGWVNICELVESTSVVNITIDRNQLFSNE